MLPHPQEDRVAVLRPLYDFVGKYASEEQPPQGGQSPIDIDQAQGFYLWGCYDRKKYWHS